MRTGTNPAKDNIEIKIDSIHRIVIPVYIPNLNDGYYKRSLEVLELCLKSLLLTVNFQTRISIIINGSCKEIEDLIYNYKREYELIDQIFYTKENIGKINGIYSIIKSNIEPIITITDADVLFCKNWQNETIKVFNNFPSAGMVSPVPSSKGYLHHTRSTFYYGLINKCIRFDDVLDPDGLVKFENSINLKLYDSIHYKKQLTIFNDFGSAVIGCGHFVATFRKEVFENSPREVCRFRVLGGSEENYIDRPNDLGGYLRLSTRNNLAYHMGNTPLPWMYEEFSRLKDSDKIDLKPFTISKGTPLSKFEISLADLIWKILIFKFRGLFFRYLGLKEKY
jgi:hypothetical protein